MARLKKIFVSFGDPKHNELKFSYNVQITTEGKFTTTMPENIAKALRSISSSMISTYSRVYFSSDTLKGLNLEIKQACEEYVSEELVSEKIVLKYDIQTACSYAFDFEKEIVPNCSYSWVKTSDYCWESGTKDLNATHPGPFGFQVYIKPYFRREYRYGSGNTAFRYERFREDDASLNQPNLRWLAGLTSISEVKKGETQELDYTEDTALFFVNILKSVCLLNERIREFTSPEKLRTLIAGGVNLLGSGL